MITIDGSLGEGGGQIVRSSLSLSLCTGQPVRVVNVRANRRKPGLARQHLTALRAAAEVGGARVEGDAVRSREVSFCPSTVRPGDYRFDVGTAGSATLVLQTVLPALVTADGPSTLTLSGGTHNQWAPPFDFLDRAFLPLLNRTGPTVTAELVRPGFYPKGGGSIRVTITPVEKLAPLRIGRRGTITARRAVAGIARLPDHVARRELDHLARRLELSPDELHTITWKRSASAGNVLWVELSSSDNDNGQPLREVVCGFGQRGVPAEKVAEGVFRRVERYLHSGAAVGEQLADQLVLPLTLAGGGAIDMVAPFAPHHHQPGGGASDHRRPVRHTAAGRRPVAHGINQLILLVFIKKTHPSDSGGDHSDEGKRTGAHRNSPGSGDEGGVCRGAKGVQDGAVQKGDPGGAAAGGRRPGGPRG